MFPNDLFPGTDLINVNLYGVMIAIGVLLCFVVLFTYAKKMGIKPKFTDFVFYTGVVAIAVGFFSAAVFQGIYNYIEDPSRGFSLTGGITFIGGLIGGVVVFLAIYLVLRKKFDNKLGDVLNFVPCCILLAHAFGRIGCFFAGCCYGGPTDSIFGVVFAPGSPAYREFGATPIHPTQLYEAVFLLVMFGITTWLVFKGKTHGRNNLAIYLMSYGVFRYINEILRADYRGTFVSLVTPSQFWSILMVLIGIALIILPRYFPVIAKTLYGKYADQPKVEEAATEDAQN